MTDHADHDDVPERFREMVENNLSQSRRRSGPDAGDGRPHRPTSDDLIVLANQRYRIRRSDEDGAAYAIDQGIAIRLSDARFRGMLSNLAREEGFLAATGATLQEALDCLAAQAMETDAVHVSVRVAETGSGVWIDNVGDAGRLVRIHDGRWDIVDPGDPGAPLFERPEQMRHLPEPDPTPTVGLDDLWRLINVAGDDRVLLVGWMVYVLSHEASSFPLLLMEAEQGTGKTAAMRVVTGLTDPSMIEAGGVPKDAGTMAVVSRGEWIIRCDNITSLTADLQDMLCRVATGGGFATRQLYTDRDLVTFRVRRPVIMTTIALTSLHADLAQRTVRITLPLIDPDRRMTDRELDALWDQTRCGLFSLLLGLTARCQQLLDTGAVPVDELPRMADYALTLAALDQINGTHGLDAYRRQQRQLSDDVISDDPLAMTMERRCAEFAHGWDGTSRTLLEMLRADMAQLSQQTWKHAPVTPRDVTSNLRRIAQPLRARGWVIQESRGTGRDSGTIVWHIQSPED